MKRETKKPSDERRPIVAYLDGWQAKVNALWEFALTPALSPWERGYDLRSRLLPHLGGGWEGVVRTDAEYS